MQCVNGVNTLNCFVYVSPELPWSVNYKKISQKSHHFTDFVRTQGILNQWLKPLNSPWLHVLTKTIRSHEVTWMHLVFDSTPLVAKSKRPQTDLRCSVMNSKTHKQDMDYSLHVKRDSLLICQQLVSQTTSLTRTMVGVFSDCTLFNASSFY